MTAASAPRTIVLCATQRCGSTMIVEDMRNTGQLGHPEEWFIPWDPAKPDIDWACALGDLRHRATRNGVTSVKIMANQLHNIEACLASFTPAPSGPMFQRVYATFSNATWVWLRREDIVAQAVSRVMAQQTGITHATAGEDHFAGNLIRGDARHSYNAATRYDYAAILKECSAITLETLTWARFFSAFHITPLRLTHETVVADTGMSHVDEFSRAIGIPTRCSKPARRMVKLGNARNHEFAEKFHADVIENRFR